MSTNFLNSLPNYGISFYKCVQEIFKKSLTNYLMEVPRKDMLRSSSLKVKIPSPSKKAKENTWNRTNNALSKNLNTWIQTIQFAEFHSKSVQELEPKTMILKDISYGATNGKRLQKGSWKILTTTILLFSEVQ